MNKNGAKTCETCGFVFPEPPGKKGGLSSLRRTAQHDEV